MVTIKNDIVMPFIHRHFLCPQSLLSFPPIFPLVLISNSSHDPLDSPSVSSNRTPSSLSTKALLNPYLYHTILAMLCLPIRQSYPLTTHTFPSNSVQSSITPSLAPVSRSFTKPISPEQMIYSSSIDNDNLLFGDQIINHLYPSSRIVFTNVNGLELSSHTAIFETLCDYMYLNNVDISCISETNFYWKNDH